MTHEQCAGKKTRNRQKGMTVARECGANLITAHCWEVYVALGDDMDDWEYRALGEIHPSARLRFIAKYVRNMSEAVQLLCIHVQM